MIIHPYVMVMIISVWSFFMTLEQRIAKSKLNISNHQYLAQKYDLKFIIIKSDYKIYQKKETIYQSILFKINTRQQNIEKISILSQV